MKLTRKAAQSLTNLRASPDFAVVVEWLSDYRELSREECCQLPPDRVVRSQGKVAVITSIFDAIEAAPSTLEKFKSQR